MLHKKGKKKSCGSFTDVLLTTFKFHPVTSEDDRATQRIRRNNDNEWIEMSLLYFMESSDSDTRKRSCPPVHLSPLLNVTWAGGGGGGTYRVPVLVVKLKHSEDTSRRVATKHASKRDFKECSTLCLDKDKKCMSLWIIIKKKLIIIKKETTKPQLLCLPAIYPWWLRLCQGSTYRKKKKKKKKTLPFIMGYGLNMK